MQSKFSTPVQMYCGTKEQADKVESILTELGYRNDADMNWTGQYSMVVTRVEDSLREFYFVRPIQSESGSLRIEYNLPLFKALAARREGDEFYPEELCRVIQPPNAGDVCRVFYETNGFGPYVHQATDQPWGRRAQSSDLRKLTVEEILAHFKEKEQPAVSRETFEQACTNNIKDTVDRIKAENDSVTITSEAFREIWNAFNPSLRHYLFYGKERDIFADTLEISIEEIEKWMQVNQPFPKALAVLDKHFKREEAQSQYLNRR